MANENTTDTAEPETSVEAATPKKLRRSRQKDVTPEAAAETPVEAVASQPGQGRTKRTGKSADGKGKTQTVAKTRAKNLGKRSGQTRAATQTIKATGSAPVLEDIADLIQLEEENARLRKALAEKLRNENADLRKRLGLA